MMGNKDTCKTCKWWGSHTDEKPRSVKECTHKEMNRLRASKKSCCSSAARWGKREKSGHGGTYISLTVMTDDRHGCRDVLTQRTGCDYGCIHHQPKEDVFKAMGGT